ncbi:uncharacterized protein LOC111626358 [Centruroides sculpturatus]|uniref:uncharacterized protein LOC111626358 n=1 Tax=Centruroides sculpturatus TaxID=218467 RepID=UPI000C6D6147|nr:uncharacterized protein LOC111626358 [Centruroides sculpturatus]
MWAEHTMTPLTSTNETASSISPFSDVITYVTSVTKPNLPNPKPTVSLSLDPRPIVIPILSCIISFPIITFAIICALRYRAQRLRKRDRLRRLQAGYRSVTLDIPNREKPSLFSRDSSSDLKVLGEKSDTCGSPASPLTSRRTSRNNSQVTFVTAAVMHVPELLNQNGRLKRGSKTVVSFWEEPVQGEDVHELSEGTKQNISISR